MINTIYELWIYRFLEAFFGGFIVINATAIVRDLYSGEEATKFFSLLGSIRSMVPMLAPAIGSLILFFSSWQAIFIFLTLYSLILSFLMIKDIKETFTYSKNDIIKSYIIVLTHKKAMTMMFILALGFSSMFSIVTKSSFIYMEYFNVSINSFPFYYGLNFILLMLFASLNVKLIKYLSQINILKIAIFIQIIFAFLFSLFNAELNVDIAAFLIAFYIAMNGLIYGNATAIVMENFSNNAGVASGLIGVIQFGLASLVSSLIVFFHGETLLPIGIGMLCIPFISMYLLKEYQKSY